MIFKINDKSDFLRRGSYTIHLQEPINTCNYSTRITPLSTRVYQFTGNSMKKTENRFSIVISLETFYSEHIHVSCNTV